MEQDFKTNACGPLFSYIHTTHKSATGATVLTISISSEHLDSPTPHSLHFYCDGFLALKYLICQLITLIIHLFT